MKSGASGFQKIRQPVKGPSYRFVQKAYDYEICIPVQPNHPPSVSLDNIGVFTLREIPAIERAATYLHQGDYDTLPEKYVFLQRWAVENGYTLGGVWRFVWHRGPMDYVDPAQYLTELQHPIDPA